MRRALILIPVLLIAGRLAFPGGRAEQSEAGTGGLIQWNSPRSIRERVTGKNYLLPQGWEEAVSGVEKIGVSIPGCLGNDPALSANTGRFTELTGVEVELLVRTEALPAAGAGSPDILCYRHLDAYLELSGKGGLLPVEAIWDDPDLWKLYPGSLKKGLIAPDGHIYGSPGRLRTWMLFYRPSLVSKPPRTWKELKELAAEVKTEERWGFVFPAGGDEGALDCLRSLIYSQGGRLNEAGGLALAIGSPEMRSAWKLLTGMVLEDQSAPLTVLQYSPRQAAELFAAGKAAMILAGAEEGTWFQDPVKAPGLKEDWAAAVPPKFDDTQPDTNMASRLELEGYAVNCCLEERKRAAAMIFLDFMRSYEASLRELIAGGGEAACLTAYDAPEARKLPASARRKAAMANAVLEAFPPAGRSRIGIIKECFAHALTGGMDPDEALEAAGVLDP